MTLPQLLVHLLRFDATIVLVLLLLLPILPVGLSLIAIQLLGALAFKSLGGGGGRRDRGGDFRLSNNNCSLNNNLMEAPGYESLPDPGYESTVLQVD